MIMGNITISSRPSADELGDGICGSCLCECEEVGINESFDDAFGTCEDWSVGSDCCGSEVFKGRIFLDTCSTHTARKDHKDGKIKAGQKYKQWVTKGYYIDGDGNHQGIFNIVKKVVN